MSNYAALELPHTVLAFNASNVGNLLDVQKSSHAGQQTLAKSGVAGDNVGEFALLDVLNQKRGIVLGETLYIDK